MVEKKELKCIDALREVLSQNVNPGFYSLNGYKEEALCLQRSDDGWEVYLGERNNRYNLAKFDTVVEACLNLLYLVCPDRTENINLKNAFFNLLIETDVA